ncbi:hypothetical protein DHEL01_v203841 [Diaporthe helianthi]|uniref:GS catalytic domain-containing protein n=1 Tax=Diaporthe helianthi TaxID=158607 RepID=A0A2P5I5I1_DIAHE|nr:hypothetical protein DHEL01_v203841 [Diaporthe helianthi]
MDPSEYGYEHWKHEHSDCELVHVMWTDYCGILNEKLVPASSLDMMYRTHVSGQSASDDLIPLTVSAAALTSLPDSKSAAEEIWPSYKTGKLLPDYDTIQRCIDSKTRATVFAKVMPANSGGLQCDPREILKEIRSGYKGETNFKAALEFQFVLRRLSDGRLHLHKRDGSAQAIVLKLVQALRTHSHRGTAGDLFIQSSDISMDGVVTIALSMSENILEAVDNFYRVKRALESITSLEGLRASFFCPLEDMSTATFSGTHLDVMCANKLRCRLHLALGPRWDVPDFSASIMESEVGATSNPTIYAFCKPNWLTYGQRCQYQGDRTPRREWMTWGTRNSKTTINFPCGFKSRRLEFGDIDCMANMYLVVASIAGLGEASFRVPSYLEDVPKADNVDEYDPADPAGYSAALPEGQRIPLTGLDACRSIELSIRQRDLLFGDIMPSYMAVREMEDKSIVRAVEQGRTTSAREVLGRWY